MKCVYLAMGVHNPSQECGPEQWLVGQQSGRYTGLS